MNCSAGLVLRENTRLYYYTDRVFVKNSKLRTNQLSENLLIDACIQLIFEVDTTESQLTDFRAHRVFRVSKSSHRLKNSKIVPKTPEIVRSVVKA